MQAKTLAPLIAVTLSGALCGQAGVGDPMPEIEVAGKFNLDFQLERLSDLRGPAFLVEYWATW